MSPSFLRPFKRGLVFVSAVFFGVQPLAACAQSAANYNLGSTQHTMSAPNTHPISINVGATHQTIQPGALLTPAEMVAVTQVLNQGHQAIQLGIGGNATGGRLNITGDIGAILNALTVPSGVSALANFATTPSINVAGDLTNGGRIYAYSSNTNINSATINASNIYNLTGALITSVIPTSLASLTGPTHPLDLSLVVSNNLVNAGSISSSGYLTLNAGGAITNALPSGTKGAAPVISGATGVSLVSTNIINSGLIEALTGNLNIASQTAANINIQNAGGTLQAANGDINIRDASFSGKFDTTIDGGSILSNNLNIWSGNGTTTVDIGTVTSVINADTGVMHLTAATPDLKLGLLNIKGDPTFFNTAGNITLSGTIGPGTGDDYAFVASGDITDDHTPLTITTDSTTSNGGSVTMIAGASFTTNTPSLPAAGNTVVIGTDTGDTGSILTITGASGTGGSIILPTLQSISTTVQTAGAKAGDVTMIAFAGHNPGSGQINLRSDSTITTYSFVPSTDTSGKVLMIAGATSGNGITIGSITTDLSGALGEGGTVFIRTATPIANGVSILDGTLSGSFGAGATQPANVTVGSITAAANVSIIAGNNVTLAPAPSTTLGNGSITTSAGNLAIIAGGNIVSVVPNTKTLTIDTIDQTSQINSGNLTMIAGANVVPSSNFNPDAGQITGASAQGGSIDLITGSTPSLTITSHANNSTPSGGNIVLVAMAGAASGTGQILLPAGSTVSTTALTNGAPGSLTILANAPSGTAISLDSINTSNLSGALTPGGNLSVAVGTAATPMSFDSNTQPTVAPAVHSAQTSNADISVGSIHSTTGNVTVTSPGNLTVGDVTSNGDGSAAISLTAGKVMTLGSTIDASSLSSGPGGNITLQAASYQFPVAGNGTFVQSLSNDTTTAQNGGTISITSTGAGLPLVVDSAHFQITVANSSKGGVAGTISLTSASDITVDGSEITASATDLSHGTGATINITAGTAGSGSVQINNTLLVIGDDTNGSTGGSVNITGNSSTPMSIGGLLGNIQAIQAGDPGKDLGGSIKITNNGTGGISVNDPSVLVVGNLAGLIGLLSPKGPMQIAGGSVFAASNGNINLSALSYTITGSGGSVLLDVSDVGGGGVGVGGSQVSITSTAKGKPINIGTVGTATGMFNINAPVTTTGNVPDTITINSGGNIAVDMLSGALSIIAAGSGTNGANLTLHAGTAGPGTVFVNAPLNVAADTTAKAGSVTIITNSTSPFIIGPGATTNGVKNLTVPVAINASGGSGGSISITNGGGISVATGALKVAPTATNNGNGGQISLIALSGNISVNDDLKVTSTSNFPGTVSLSAIKGTVAVIGQIDVSDQDTAVGGPFNGSVTITTGSSKVFQIAPNTFTSGNGVSVGIFNNGGTNGGSIDIFNVGTGGIFVDHGGISNSNNSSSAAGPELTLSASGGNIVSFNLSVAGVSGGSMTLSAAKGAVQTGDLSANGTNDNGGSITVITGSSKPLIVNGAGANSTGTIDVSSAPANAGSISLTNNAGGVLIGSASAAFNLGNAQNGAHVHITSNSSVPFTITNSLGNITNGLGGALNASSNGGLGGVIAITNLGAGGITVADASNLKVAGNGQQAGTISLQAPKGKMTFTGNNQTLSADGSGQISLLAQSYVFAGTGGVTLSANALGGSGDKGGLVSVFSLSKALLQVASSAFSISIAGAAGGSAGGCLSMMSAGNLQIDASPGFLVIGAEDSNASGATLTLVGSNVSIAGDLNADAGAGNGNGGSINITSNSTTAFTFGASGTPVNGITGNISALSGDVTGNGGTIGIRNNGTGGIKLPALSAINVFNPNAQTGNGGNIDLEAPKGTLNIGNGVMFADAASHFGGDGGNGGSITINAGIIAVAIGNHLTLHASASNPNANVDGNGGAIFVTQTSLKTPMSLGSADQSIFANVAFAGTNAEPGTISITSGNNIVINNSFGDASANIILTVAGASTITSTITPSVGALTAANLTLRTGTGNIGAFDTTPGNFGVGGANFQTNSLQSLTVITSGGSAFINNTNSLSLAVNAVSITQAKGQKTPPSFVLGLTNNVSQVTTMGTNGDISVPTGTVSIVDPSLSSNIDISNNIIAKTINLITRGATGTILQNPSPTSVIGGSNSTLTISAGAGANLGNTAVGTLNITTVGGETYNVNNIGAVKVNVISQTLADQINISASGTITAGEIDTASQISLTTNPGSNGSIIVSGLFTGTGANTDKITLTADGFGSIVSSGSELQASNVTLVSAFGNLGTAANPLDVEASDSTTGTVNVSANTGGAGQVNLISQGSNTLIVAIQPSQSGGDFSISAGRSVVINQSLTSLNGGVFVTANNSLAASSITIASQASVFAGGGPLILNLLAAPGSTTGQINIGAGASLTANGSVQTNGAGGVVLAIGQIPTTFIVGTPPTLANTTFQPSVPNSNVFFGANPTSITDSPVQNLVDSTNGQVAFNVANGAASPQGTINLGGGVNITSAAGETRINSLDLTSTTAVTALVALQHTNNSGVTGALTVSGGKATGGTLIIDSNSVNLANLTGLNIPAKVTVTVNDAQQATPLGVILPGLTKPILNALINGKLQFTATAGNLISAPLLSIISPSSGIVFNLAKTGSITSDGNLNLGIGGDTTIAGTVSAPGILSIGTTASNSQPFATKPVVNTGNITLSGNLSSALQGSTGTLPSVLQGGTGVMNIQSSAGLLQSGGSIVGGTVNLSVNGSNSLTQKSGTLTAGLLGLFGGSLTTTFGTPKNGLIATQLSIGDQLGDLSTFTVTGSSQLDVVNAGAQMGAVTIVAPKGLIDDANINATAVTIKSNNIVMNEGINAISQFGAINVASLTTSGLTISGTGSFDTVNGPITVTSTGAMSVIIIGGGGFFDNIGGDMNFLAKGNMIIAAAITPGLNADSYTGGVVSFAQDLGLGAIGISTTKGNISFSQGDHSAFLDSNGNIKVTTPGNISINSGTQFVAIGASIIMLAKGVITNSPGPDPINLTADALGTTATNGTGGGIELGSGVTKSALLPAFNLPPGTVPTGSLGSSVQINNGLTGAVVLNATGGGLVNLSNGALVPAVLTLNSGAMVFDVVGAKSSINLQDIQLKTNAFAPIGWEHSADDFIVDASNDE